MNMKTSKRLIAVLLSGFLMQINAQAASPGDTRQSNAQTAAPQTTAALSPQEIQQLVAPIALYPDALVAQVLAASTYPTEIVEADRWLQSHSNLKDEELAKAVDQQTWDPSVKALTQFPSVLENMDKNLSWTSSLGDAYANQQQDVTDAVQLMRQRAQAAGNLNSNQDEKVTSQDGTIAIEPVNPDLVYVPAYDPWLAYGDPIFAYPGWYPVPGIFFGGPSVSFGFGLGVGFFGGFGWGWHHWGYDWHGRYAIHDHDRYVSYSRTIINRNNFGRDNLNHGGFNRGNVNRGNAFEGGGHTTFRSEPGTHSGAFSGFDHGGTVRGFSARGRSSAGGGFHGGGFHGGGSHGGGRHR